MSKTLNELASDLKIYLIELQSDAHNKGNLRPERYNNLKLVMDLVKNKNPHVFISVAMSEAEYLLPSGEKINGGLGPDDRFVLRWMAKPNTIPMLMECWKQAEKSRGRVDR